MNSESNISRSVANSTPPVPRVPQFKQKQASRLARHVSTCLTAAAVVATALIAVPPRLAMSQAVELVIADVKAVAKGYRTSKLKGTNVTNGKDEKIGEVDDIIIAREGGVYAVLDVGGFLGIRGLMVAVPFESLVLDDAGRKIQLPGATREALKALPVFRHAT